MHIRDLSQVSDVLTNYPEGQVQNSKTCHVTTDSDGKMGGEGKNACRQFIQSSSSVL